MGGNGSLRTLGTTFITSVVYPLHDAVNLPSGGIMETRQKRPNVVLSRSGVLQVAPAEIFKSEVGRAEIRKTARLDAARQARERAREKAIVKK
jgi:hypothetical protein